MKFWDLKHVAGGWHEVDASDSIREASVRFLRVHPLRAADALQLAAASTQNHEPNLCRPTAEANPRLDTKPGV